MRRVAGLLCLFVLAAAAHADQRAVQRAIEKQYKSWAKAYSANDVDTILGILTTDYTLKTYAGQTIAYKDYKASLEKRKELNSVSPGYVTKMKKLVLDKPDHALVTSNETSTTVLPDPVTGKRQKIVHTHVYLDTWVLQSDIWRLQSTVTQQEITTFDGKPG